VDRRARIKWIIMASDEQRPVDPRVSAYAKTMASAPKDGKRVAPFEPPRIRSAKNAAEADSPQRPLPGRSRPEPAAPQAPEAPLPPQEPRSDSAPGFLKKTSEEPERKSLRGENNYRKVAKFLILVGKDEAAKILAKLDPEQVERVTREISTISRVENAEAEVLLAEFRSLLGGGEGASPGSGGVSAARGLLRAAFGKEKGDAFLVRAVPEAAENPFGFLEDFEGDQIALLLKGESPAAAALILSRLEPKTAAAAINKLEPTQRLETLKRIAKLGKVAPEVLERTAAALREKARSVGRETTKVVDGRAALAEILKRTDASVGDRLLDELREADPELGMDIKDRLFTLDDIVKVEDRAVQEKLRTLSDKDIALLLKGRRPAFVEKILSNVTAARRTIIAEERELLGPVPRSEADEAAGAFLRYFRQGREEGRIVLMDDSDIVT
jgi:flagellar motor switch protein FliG